MDLILFTTTFRTWKKSWWTSKITYPRNTRGRIFTTAPQPPASSKKRRKKFHHQCHRSYCHQFSCCRNIFHPSRPIGCNFRWRQYKWSTFTFKIGCISTGTAFTPSNNLSSGITCMVSTSCTATSNTYLSPCYSSSARSWRRSNIVFSPSFPIVVSMCYRPDKTVSISYTGMVQWTSSRPSKHSLHPATGATSNPNPRGLAQRYDRWLCN